MKFIDKLLNAARKNNSLVCVGLDSDIEKIPQHLSHEFENQAVLEFNERIIDATKDLVCAYKSNIAFYELLGPEGAEILKKTRDYIPSDIPVIIDAKRGDVANTAKAYAKSLLKIYDFDAVTVNPYLGYDAVEPFLEYKEKGIFVLCRTSNPGSGDIQDLECNGRPLYQTVAQKIKEWNDSENIGVVAGATFPEELKVIREIVGEGVPILIPGIGKQSGEIEKSVESGTNADGELAIINSSRGIIFASSGRDYARAAREATLALRDEINRYR